MNPVSAVASAVSNITDIFFGGRRRREQNQGPWAKPTDYAQDNTPTYVMAGLFIILLAIVVGVIIKANR